VTPVRVLYNKTDGLQAGAIAPDPETRELALRHDLLSRLAVSPEVEQIDAAEFDRRCAAFPVCAGLRRVAAILE
jgi:hypothetical protein